MGISGNVGKQEDVEDAENTDNMGNMGSMGDYLPCYDPLMIHITTTNENNFLTHAHFGAVSAEFERNMRLTKLMALLAHREA